MEKLYEDDERKSANARPSQKSKARPQWGLLVVIAVAAFVLIQMCDSGSGDVSSVKESMTETYTSGRTYETAPLEGGTAVLVDGTAAYWVDGSRVYAANGFAKTWSPGISYAPTGIDFDSVRRAVGR